MRSAAAVAAARGADLIDLNMGCPVPKVMKTGAGAALISDPDAAVAVALAAARGLRPARHRQAARRAASRAGSRASSWRAGWSRTPASPGSRFHPRSAAVRHKGTPDYELAARLVAELPVPVIVSGGMEGAEHIRAVFESTGCAAVMLARGALGNPWLFAQVLGDRTDEPTREEIVDEWRWVLDRAVEHLGPGPRRPLPAQVPSLVRRAARGGQDAPGGAPAGRDDRRAARRHRRAARPFWPPRRTLLPSGRRSARPKRGSSFSRTPPRTTHAEGRHPHPRGTREAQAGDRAPLRHPSA